MKSISGTLSIWVDGEAKIIVTGFMELTLSDDDNDDITLQLASINGASISTTFEPAAELTEPLGLVDQLTWGPLLN